MKRNGTAFFTLIVVFNILLGCGGSVSGGYSYAGEIDGTQIPEKEKTNITLKADNTIKITWSGGKTYEFSERVGEYKFSKDSTSIQTKFKDGLPPFSMHFKKGELTWQIIDSTSVYNKVISKFEKSD